MGKLIDMTGWVMKEHGVPESRLTVIEKSESKNGKVYWKCRCECGNEVIADGTKIRSGHTKSCGCFGLDKLTERNKEKSLVGQVFGKLTVLEDSGKRNWKNIIYKCQCECGKIVEVPGGNLTSNNTKSCGCYKSNFLKEYYLEKDNLVGQTFGKLLVIERTEKRHNRAIIYKCQCECGNIIETSSSYLRNGDTQSCGCINSKGEEKISRILRDNNISFETQKKFDDCRNPKTNNQFKFDFYINNNYIIEYDGIQHFKEWTLSNNTLEERKKYDELKNQYCKENNIPIIRIPYTRFKELCLQDLLLETSKYLI